MATWTIEVRRPNGEVETVVRDDPRNLLQAIEKLRKDTRAAGRGEVLTVNGQSKAPAIKVGRWQRGCALYDREQGCPLHGEGCA